MSHQERSAGDSAASLSASAEVFAFNTLVTISAECNQAIVDGAIGLCAHFERAFSRTVADGDIARLNSARGKPVKVDPDTARLVSAALEYCTLSGGLFDITMGAVTSLWNFKDGIVPAASDVTEALRHVDYRLVHVDGETISLDDPLAMIDLGGIAKGYIADAIADHLREAGVTSGIINLGGNVLVIGSRPDGAPWRVGIRHPEHPRDALMGVVEVADCSVVTSGLYERNFTLDGVFYHHILDRETGFPAVTDVKSVTLITPTSIEGDGLSTALLLMGRERALGFVRAREGCEAIVVGMDDGVYGTSGIGTRIPLRTTR